MSMVTKIQTIPTTVDKEKDQQTATQQVVKQKYKASELLALRKLKAKTSSQKKYPSKIKPFNEEKYDDSFLWESFVGKQINKIENFEEVRYFNGWRYKGEKGCERNIYLIERRK